MLERTQIFVDTSYLLASFYNSWEIGARAQLEIDLPEVVSTLGQMVQQHLHQPVHRQFWYDGIPESGPHRYQRALRTCDGVQLRAGQLIEWGERRTQKAVDTRLVADLVLAGVRRDTTDIVLVSGDADMIPGVQEAVNHGVRVHLYGFGWDSMSSALRHACDSTTILDPREDFADCMQLEILEGPLPPVVHQREEHDEDPSPNSSPDATSEDAAAGDGAREGEFHDAPSTADLPETPLGAADQGETIEAELVEAHNAETPTTSPSVNPSVAKPGMSGDSGTSGISGHSGRPVPAPASTPAPEPEPGQEEAAPQSETQTVRVTSRVEESVEVTVTKTTGQSDEAKQSTPAGASAATSPGNMPTPGSVAKATPNPSMMAPRRKLRSRYVPLPNEVWSSAGYQSPFDVGQQYAIWWYENAATPEQRDSAHLLSGGGLPPEIDRPLLQFACETLHEYTLTESQRVALRDGFHSGIRGVLVNNQRG
ncbi:NYN domain-containing protein [Corynebacterium sp. 153RC1]|uniref:NYN domain-containing protein n=1 Tax=unclassified Corynebacterium TaxID=2624378 RepID=UPI00211C93DB|nr:MULTISPECIES: NYN domain-containing protein [unclassified Corynebacterium]MCQ9371429.1 NYN domain-containing protein [Corynebacterium sp. 35RC1]MCQ9353333.1 NYN domain-containing protein [Corynebacterium sp. 209RC1]MCQ9355588.1 NYN domain-containing protein [Corynebacterium sp. 1222RC1]MCQ9357772.1 NYN domain-containing protein [Corynebacterium sp. 122RC1]MCQ9359977.1 NYN domain-containing protein [Corynebacterium sp. 142RC1]